MMYPFLTLDDGTAIVRSDILSDSRVKVYMERPDEKIGFFHTTCFLPEYEWPNILGFSESKIESLREIVRSKIHMISGFSME